MVKAGGKGVIVDLGGRHPWRERREIKWEGSKAVRRKHVVRSYITHVGALIGVLKRCQGARLNAVADNRSDCVTVVVLKQTMGFFLLACNIEAVKQSALFA